MSSHWHMPEYAPRPDEPQDISPFQTITQDKSLKLKPPPIAATDEFALVHLNSQHAQSTSTFNRQASRCERSGLASNKMGCADTANLNVYRP